MGFSCGIVGLPNVGKSTIFNALTAAEVEAANYPFCTIDPNMGIVPVPDERLDILAKVAKSAKIVPTTVQFLDIAGLVKGASEGEGLGNQFLGHIRSVDAIVHVVRCFIDDNVTHVHGSVSPRRDVEVIDTELLLADLSSVEKRIDKVRRAAKSGDKAQKDECERLEIAYKYLSDGTPLRVLNGSENDLSGLDFLTQKPVLYVANVSEEDATVVADSTATGALAELVDIAKAGNSEVVVISGSVEAEISRLHADERSAFLQELGLARSGLDRLIVGGYNLLKLITFFTIGPKEAHAWTCRSDDNAVAAAGKIHSDFAKGFIRAEVISCEDYIACGGENAAKENGKLRIEGKNYQMRDGDVVYFGFNV